MEWGVGRHRQTDRHRDRKGETDRETENMNMKLSRFNGQRENVEVLYYDRQV